MIKAIVSSSPHIQLQNNWAYYPNINNSTPAAGMLRYNSNVQQIEVTDGMGWLPISTTPSISLSPEVEELIRWAKQHRAEVEAEKKLRENHPAIKNAWEQYQVVKTLSINLEETSNV
jgi:hypothetical protein